MSDAGYISLKFIFDSAPEIVSWLRDSGTVPAIVAIESLLVCIKLLIAANLGGLLRLLETHGELSLSIRVLLISVHLALHLLSVYTLSNWSETLSSLHIKTAMDLAFSLLLSSCSIGISKYIFRLELGHEAAISWHVALSLRILGHLTFLHLLDGSLLTSFIDLSTDIASVTGHTRASFGTLVHFC